jgi:Tfp pilus assembly protein PilO
MQEKLTDQIESKIQPKILKDFFLNFLIPVVAVAISVVLILLFILPTMRSLPKLHDNLNSAVQTRTVLQNKIATLQKLASDQDTLNTDVTLVEKVLPSSIDAPLLMDETEQITKGSGLKVTQDSYSPGVTSAPETAPGTVPSTTVSNTADIALTAAGDYGQLISFMHTVENAARVLTVTGFHYSASGSNTSGALTSVAGNASSLEITLSLSSPYLQVKSNAVTDDPLTIDISSTAFTNFMTTLNSMTYYDYSVSAQESSASQSSPAVQGAKSVRK